MNIEDDLPAVIAACLKIPVDKVDDDLGYGSIPQWDSLAHVNLMLRLEEECGLKIDEDTMVELTSVRAIRAFLQEQS